jgi:hypothetical protein
MSDDQAFLIAVFAIVSVAIAGIHVNEYIAGPKVSECSITFKDSVGNKHQFIGRGYVY